MEYWYRWVVNSFLFLFVENDAKMKWNEIDTEYKNVSDVFKYKIFIITNNNTFFVFFDLLDLRILLIKYEESNLKSTQ